MIATAVLYLCGYLTCVYIVYINCGFSVRALSWMSASSLSVLSEDSCSSSQASSGRILSSLISMRLNCLWVYSATLVAHERIKPEVMTRPFVGVLDDPNHWQTGVACARAASTLSRYQTSGSTDAPLAPLRLVTSVGMRRGYGGRGNHCLI